MSVALSPIINPHQSIHRRRHIIDGECRTVPHHQQRRRQSIAAMTSNTRLVPPTPHKSNYAIRKSAYNGKRIKKYNKYQSGRSRTPSPNKKRRFALYTQPLNKSADRNNNNCSSQYYQNLGLIGVGSFSQVFKVQNACSKKQYALKKSTSYLNTRDAVDEALNEVQIMRMLQNENDSEKEDEEKKQDFDFKNKHIIKFIDFWISYDRQLHQIYDYYEYGTLLDIVEYNQRLNYLQILEIIEQICFGLKLVHSLNIIHIDLKPSNIFITKDYILKIGDFGISINLNKHNILTPTTKKKSRYLFSGDPIYIAPELMNDFNRTLTNDINIKTDIYSLGIILLELLCDIKAPSQGQIFQNLRRNIIDFNIMEPSPIKSSKLRKKKKTKQFGFSFTSNDHDITDDININTNFTQNADDFKVIEDIDNEIKILCKNMLQKNSHSRPNCNEILDKIHKILNNERYSKHFQTSKPLKALSLPPKTVNNPKNINNNASGYNSVNNSNCNSNKKQITTNDNNDNDNDNISWFYQESPKCYNSLFHYPSPSISPIRTMNEEFQLNLNSAFDNAQNQMSPFLFSSTSKDNKYNDNKYNDNDNINNVQQNAENAENAETTDSEDFKPKKLLFSFM